MLLGMPWRNYEELEESISLPELEHLLEESRKQKHEDRKFAAALKGVDIDEGKKSSAEEVWERVNKRVDERLGRTKQKEQEEWDFFGLDMEEEF